jgi:protein TonB
MRQEAGAEPVLFASVLNARASQAELRVRLLRVVPLILALHLLVVLVVGPYQREMEGFPVRAQDDDAPVLKLLAARPAHPSAVAAAAMPAQAATRRVHARKLLPRPKPAPLPALPPEPQESPPSSEYIPQVDDAPLSPGGASEAEGGAVATGIAVDSVEGAVVGGGEGGVLGGALSSGVPGPPPLTPEEREEWVERYMKKLIRDRFERVRYPHLASAAGIQGEVLMRVSISSQGRLLKLELLGRCPHPVLCDSAQETVRNAEPFPPPPPELGSPCLLELPFRYRIR